jgi:prolyl oligopeptidase
MMHGEIDREVPFSQSLQLFRELKDLGKNVRLLLFPREGHGFRERGHQDQYIEEMLKWFRKYSS